MKHLQATILLMLVALCVCAESYKTVRVTGEFHMTLNDNITPQDAMILAQEDAKKKALIEVCGQQISIFEQVESSTRTGEIYTSATSSEVNGEIAEFTIIKEWPGTNGNVFVFYCEASVKVKQGLKRDPEFTATVSGLEPLYFDQDLMTFMVEPTKDCYLNIFIYDDKGEVNRLYPNVQETSKKMKAHVREEFPIYDGVDGYTIEKDINNKSSEINKIVLLFTKEKCEAPNFIHKEGLGRVNDLYYDRDVLLKWITSIPSDKKFIYTTTFEIRKKRK